MKRLITLIGAILMIAFVSAQSPDKMSYQAVVRNASNQLVANTAVGLRVSILQGSATGTEVFKEIYNPNPSTNANGLVTVEIGSGIAITGAFASIDWSDGPYFIKTEIDPTGSTNYSVTGTSQLLSVPYALYAKMAETVSGGITETDPVFSVSPASGITAVNISNWNTAFGWGNHSGLYRPATWVPSWSDVTGKPSTFTPSAHSHSATDITSGTFDAARIPTLDITTKTSGTLSVARGGTGISSYTAGNYIYASGATTLAQRTPAQVLSNIGAAAVTHAHAASDITSGTLAIARIPTGNTASTVSLGNHTHGNITIDGKIGTAAGRIITTGTGGALQATAGTSAGQMLYWNGSAWVNVPPGNNGQTLVFLNGAPTWWPQGMGVNDVYNPTTGKIWMDRNLGATQVATGSTDANSYGHLYQWGRGTDGHQIRTSSTTTTLSSSNTPGNASFILAPNSPYDWRSPQNDNLWQGASGVNNPCPTGYRLPTEAEWNAERLSWSSNNSAGAFASPLKLPMAGRRSYSNGSLNSVGSYGYYWSSAVSGIFSGSLYFHSTNATMYYYTRAFGSSVRCLKDN